MNFIRNFDKQQEDRSVWYMLKHIETKLIEINTIESTTTSYSNSIKSRSESIVSTGSLIERTIESSEYSDSSDLAGYDDNISITESDESSDPLNELQDIWNSYEEGELTDQETTYTFEDNPDGTWTIYDEDGNVVATGGGDITSTTTSTTTGATAGTPETTVVRDYEGNVISTTVTNADGSQTTTNADGSTTTTQTLSDGSVVTIGSDGTTTTTVVNPDGSTTTTSSSLGETTTSTTTTNPDGSTTTETTVYITDEDGNITETHITSTSTTIVTDGVETTETHTTTTNPDGTITTTTTVTITGTSSDGSTVTTTSTINPDGTNTTTTTISTTTPATAGSPGTTTDVTTYSDGTTATTVTSPDGTSTTTITNSDGSTETYTENPDGSTTINGTDYDADGFPIGGDSGDDSWEDDWTDDDFWGDDGE